MKGLIYSLLPLVILALVVAGCASTGEEDTFGDDTGLPQDETGSTVLETPDAEVGEEGAMTTEETEVTEEEAMTSEETEVTEEEAMTSEETEDVAESAQAGTTTDEAEVIPPTGAVNLNRISNLVDFEVWNTNNEQIGEVSDIVINQNSSQIEYVIVESGGFLGLGAQEIPVPWQAIHLQDAAMGAESSAQSDESQVGEMPQNVFTLNITEEKFEQMPEFDLTPLYEPEDVDVAGTDAETISLEQLEQEIHTFWQSDMSQSGSTDVAGEQSDEMAVTGGPKKLILANELLDAALYGEDSNFVGEVDDTDVQARAEEYLGEVEEILVDLNSGKVTYLLVFLDEVVFLPDEPVDTDTTQQQPPTVGDTAQQEVVTGDAQLATIEVVPVPLAAVDWNEEEDSLTYTGSQSLQEAPFINFDEIENVDEIEGETFDWQSEVDSFWDFLDNDADIQDTDSP